MSISDLLAASAAKRRAAGKPAPAPAEAPKLAWESVDPATLPDDIREAFYAIGKARSGRTPGAKIWLPGAPLHLPSKYCGFSEPCLLHKNLLCAGAGGGAGAGGVQVQIYCLTFAPGYALLVG